MKQVYVLFYINSELIQFEWDFLDGVLCLVNIVVHVLRVVNFVSKPFTHSRMFPFHGGVVV